MVSFARSILCTCAKMVNWSKLYAFTRFLPEVRRPGQLIHNRQKVIYTTISLFIRLTADQLPLYGIPVQQGTTAPDPYWEHPFFFIKLTFGTWHWPHSTIWASHADLGVIYKFGRWCTSVSANSSQYKLISLKHFFCAEMGVMVIHMLLCLDLFEGII